MVATDIATRVWNHTFKLDPIIRSLLDTDFYKLLMQQMVFGLYPDVNATFQLINRTTTVKLANDIDETELRAQLDHARTLKLTKREMIWLAGNTFYGTSQIFRSDYLEWLTDFQLPPYELKTVDGQFELTFEGPWTHTMMWEIPALAIINELRSRAAMRGFERFELDIVYARAKTKMWEKVERLKTLPDLKISDFGSRRRHSFLWQRWCVEALKEGLGDRLLGSSNVMLAMETDLEAIGTNAHELPMVLAALADSEEALRAAPFKVLEDWQSYYGGNLLVVLPDTFGTATFLKDAPDWLANWTGFRPDSAPPIEGGEEIVRWWISKGVDPRERLLVFSDGLDSDTIEEVYRHFHGRVRMSFGWGTNLTNDFRDVAPEPADKLDPISLVCKVVSANGRPAVKLSDNAAKATGDPDAVERYLQIFGEPQYGERKVAV